MISVYIPVGPYPFYREYLGECLDSVRAQTHKPAEILLIDDMAGLNDADYLDCRIWRAPWRLGIPAVNNVGVALAKTDLVLYCGCDDKLMPNCLEMCAQAWEKYQDRLGYYWLDIQYSTGETQALPTGHAMVHKALWKHTGGYPPESAVGACDCAFVSMLMTQGKRAGTLIHVDGGPLSWHREHPQQYTRQQQVGPGAIIEVRKNYGDLWQPIEGTWGRYE